MQIKNIGDFTDFNPHSRKGSDKGSTAFNCCSKISIHTPARGVTDAPISPYTYVRHFNPHSRKGSDLQRGLEGVIACISIHTPARGVTPAPAVPPSWVHHFNPHSRKGSDPASLPSCFLLSYFNPHSRKGSDNISFSHCTHGELFQSTLPQGE